MTHQQGVGGLGENFDDQLFILNGFNRRPTDKRISDSYPVELPPSASIEAVPHEFLYVVPDNNFLLQEETLLEGEFQIIKADNTKIDTTAKVSLCNFSSAALFQLIECKINDEAVSNVNAKLYPYKGVIF